MKIATVKSVLVTLLFAVAAQTGTAFAHGLTTSLGAKADATDLYQITCFTDGGGATHHLFVTVQDLLPVPEPNPVLSVQVQKGRLAKNRTDRGPDGDEKPSPEVIVEGGNGQYYVMVDKSSAGEENYDLVYHCQSKAGAHTGTTLFQLQNE